MEAFLIWCELNFYKSTTCVFGDSFCSFRDGMSGQFSWKEQLDCCLDFSWTECSSLVKSNQFASFKGNSIEDIIDEWVHNVHSFSWNTNFWVYLSQDLVNIKSKSLLSSSCLFLIIRILLCLDCLNCLFCGVCLWWFWWCHFY